MAEVANATMAALQADLAAGRTSAVALTEAYLARIAAHNPRLNAVRETNPDTVEFKHADGIRKSARVPNVRTQLPGSANTASSGSKDVPSSAFALPTASDS